MIGRRSHEEEQLKLLGRHVDVASHEEHRIIGKIDSEVGEAHHLYPALACRFGRCLISSKHCLNPCHQLLGIEGLLHIVVGAELKTKHLVKDLALG